MFASQWWQASNDVIQPSKKERKVVNIPGTQLVPVSCPCRKVCLEWGCTWLHHKVNTLFIDELSPILLLCRNQNNCCFCGWKKSYTSWELLGTYETLYIVSSSLEKTISQLVQATVGGWFWLTLETLKQNHQSAWTKALNPRFFLSIYGYSNDPHEQCETKPLLVHSICSEIKLPFLNVGMK